MTARLRWSEAEKVGGLVTMEQTLGVEAKLHKPLVRGCNLVGFGSPIRPYPIPRSGFFDEQHAANDLIMLDEVMIQRSRNMQDDETQQHIHKDIMDVAAFMAPFRAGGGDFGQGDDAEQV